MAVAADPRKREEPKRICGLSTPKLVEKILEFIQKFTDTNFYDYQLVFAQRVVESVVGNDGDVITALWSRQSGKTEGVADITLGLAIIMPALANAFPDDPRVGAFRRGFRIGIFAPILEQATISYSRMRECVSKDHCQAFLADPEIDVQVTVSRGDTLAFSNGSVIQARSASPESQIEGKTYHLVICEEAQKLSRQKVEKEIMPMLAATNGSCVKIGTAWESRGGFHTSIQDNVEVHRKTGKRNHFEFPYDKVIASKKKQFQKDGNTFHLNYEKFVNKEIHRLGGIDSIEFKMNFRCLWNESRVIAVSQETLASAAILDMEAEPPGRTGFQVAGLDLGKVNDRTVLTVTRVDYESPRVNLTTMPGAEEEKQVFYPKTICDWLELEGAFEGEGGQYEAVIEFLRFCNVKVLVIDASGMGGGIAFEGFQNRIGESIELVPFVYGLGTKSEGFKYYFQELKSRRFLYPAGPATQQRIEYRRFISEHIGLDRQMIGNHVIVAAEDGPGNHDDYPNSAMLSCWAEKIAQSTMMPDVQISGGGARGSSVHSSGPPKHRYAGGRRYGR